MLSSLLYSICNYNPERRFKGKSEMLDIFLHAMTSENQYANSDNLTEI